ncbi:OsmC family protein [Solidesulfovibrio sp.]|uniref:OsmC family protein n=1 Tax=Solidesulfovibrio sp. TaxID=2910990 RepID=UPI002622772E|nr:OsmC family protein [Solidesulfovibrio sp.]
MMHCRSLDTPYQVSFSNGVFEAVCDATSDKGGSGLGFRPHELLEAALGSCTAMMVRMYADNHKIPLEEVVATVSLDRSDPETTAFVCSLTFIGEDLTSEHRRKLLRAARACHVRRTLSRKLVFREIEES